MYQLPDSDHQDVDRAVAAARDAFEGWSKMSPEERSRILLRIAESLESRIDAFASAESRDQGKPIQLARDVEIPRAITNFRYFGSMILNLDTKAYPTEGGFNYSTRSPLGVAGLIAPWNLPLYLITWKIAPAIAFGNTAVCKPSELTSLTASMLGEAFNEAGLPPGVCNIVMGTGAGAGSALTAHRDVPIVSFTGGTATAKAITDVTTPQLKKVSLELGGKNPNIVFADANFDKAVATSVRSSFQNQGEICLCGSRILVEESIHDAFVEAFVGKTKKFRVGDPANPGTQMGALVSKEHLDKVRGYIELARSEGGEILAGGCRPAKLFGVDEDRTEEFAGGYFLEPTIISGLEWDCRVLQEEIFGPVVTINTFRTDDEAVRLANSVRYGLSASLWTQDISRAHRLAEQIDAGTVWINSWMKRDLRVPFGGMKSSGIGREGGEYSLDFYTELKNICVMH